MSTQEAVEQEAGDCKQIWQTHAEIAKAPWRQTQGSRVTGGGPLLQPIEGHQVRSVALAFSARKGFQCAHPGWISWLSDAWLEAAAALLNLIEQTGLWPEGLALLIKLLEKKDTDATRPIGLITEPARIYEQIRKEDVAIWRCQANYSFDACARGKRIEDAVWAQVVSDEAAPDSGCETATALIDLTKAFESSILSAAWAS